MKKMKVKWLGKPQKHDYPAAQSYLSLTLDPKVAKDLADRLERAEMTEYAVKNIFRASGLSLLGSSLTKRYLRCCCTETMTWAA